MDSIIRTLVRDFSSENHFYPFSTRLLCRNNKMPAKRKKMAAPSTTAADRPEAIAFGRIAGLNAAAEESWD